MYSHQQSTRKWLKGSIYFIWIAFTIIMFIGAIPDEKTSSNTTIEVSSDIDFRGIQIEDPTNYQMIIFFILISTILYLLIKLMNLPAASSGVS